MRDSLHDVGSSINLRLAVAVAVAACVFIWGGLAAHGGVRLHIWMFGLREHVDLLKQQACVEFLWQHGPTASRSKINAGRSWIMTGHASKACGMVVSGMWTCFPLSTGAIGFCFVKLRVERFRIARKNVFS